ncbi:MAG: hypothetical protein KatS3mg002_1069 [Candidatus Woesearchaeota archaeon]|nr:MAG: hypothetical protein KatS3mg002_1069 [Candidatus Woesearchaeota archaeon]
MTEVTFTVTSGSADGNERVSNGQMQIDTIGVNMTSSTNSSAQWWALWLFNTSIPIGATINSAKLKLWFYDTNNDNPNGVFYGEAVDNSNLLTTTAYNISSRARTSGSVSWVATNVIGSSPNGWVDSPDISNIIQEICNRSGRSENFNLSIIWLANNNSVQGCLTRSFEGDSSLTANLIIDYTSSGSGNIVSGSAVLSGQHTYSSIPVNIALASSQVQGIINENLLSQKQILANGQFSGRLDNSTFSILEIRGQSQQVANSLYSLSPKNIINALIQINNQSRIDSAGIKLILSQLNINIQNLNQLYPRNMTYGLTQLSNLLQTNVSGKIEIRGLLNLVNTLLTSITYEEAGLVTAEVFILNQIYLNLLALKEILVQAQTHNLSEIDIEGIVNQISSATLEENTVIQVESLLIQLAVANLFGINLNQITGILNIVSQTNLSMLAYLIATGFVGGLVEGSAFLSGNSELQALAYKIITGQSLIEIQNFELINSLIYLLGQNILENKGDVTVSARLLIDAVSSLYQSGQILPVGYIPSPIINLPPSGRTYIIPYENRLYIVDKEGRVFLIDFENRRFFDKN